MFSILRRAARAFWSAFTSRGALAARNIAVERCIKTIKDEGLRRIFVPFRERDMQAEVEAFLGWYDDFRPHEALGAATPSEIYRTRRPACRGPRIEPRARYPTRPGERLRGKKGAVVRLCIGHPTGRSHLPVVRLRVAA